jgi:hypothetical protein
MPGYRQSPLRGWILGRATGMRDTHDFPITQSPNYSITEFLNLPGSSNAA